MEYTVVPFRATITKGQGADTAAQQLSELINEHAQRDWKYVRLESVSTIVTTPAVPGNAGCMGLGATPPIPAVHEETVVYMAVFQRG